MTDLVETCRPDMYTIVYKINVVLLTDVRYFCYVNLLEPELFFFLVLAHPVYKM